MKLVQLVKYGVGKKKKNATVWATSLKNKKTDGGGGKTKDSDKLKKKIFGLSF